MTDPLSALFVDDVTRDIPPVVYFDQQSPEKLAAEVREYIITGGFAKHHPGHRRVPNGIHEQYVKLLNAISDELERPGGPSLPTAWISGFYGSGKSSFAKLLGLALDGVALPDGTSLAKALLDRDTSHRRRELHDAWDRLRRKIDPIAVVFDIGGFARDHEHIHQAVLRALQQRLDYAEDPLVAQAELKLERAGEWPAFLESARTTLGKPWSEISSGQFADEQFSEVMHALHPQRYEHPLAWFESRAGTHTRSESPEEAVKAIADMVKFRKPGATVFLVVDEVSQYVLSHKDRVDRLRAFATALGSGLNGGCWLLALGQQKLDEEADESFLVWAKDRFPDKLRVHLATTNIRDVVHKRLLAKTVDGEAQLTNLFARHRANLKLYAFGCEDVTPDAFVPIYPMLPGHIDLLMQITTALRTRSSRAQGDDQAIRGLLQLLGELFRDQGLAEAPIGTLVTLDRIYEVQHTALDSDVQSSMARILNQCADDPTGQLTRVAKAVALLELIQDTLPTDAKLVAQCLYERLDAPSNLSDVTDALETLRRRNLLGYSEKHGYKIQSSAGEEWERQRRDIPVPTETLSELVQAALTYLVAEPDRPRLQGRPFPWAAVFSDGRRFEDATLKDPRDDAAFKVDFRYLTAGESAEADWVKKSDETALRDKLVWVCGARDEAERTARELARSDRMVRKYAPREPSLTAARKMLLQQEKIRTEELQSQLRKAVTDAWMAGRLYFRGRSMRPTDHGPTFSAVLLTVANRTLPDLFPHFEPTQVSPAELKPLLEDTLAGPSPKFLTGALGILELDSGKYVPTCAGVVPRRIAEYLERTEGAGGTTLLAHFGGPPYGYVTNVVKACLLGLLRAGKLKIETEAGTELTAFRDAGVREVFDRDRDFRRCNFYPAGDDDIGTKARARICRFFDKHLATSLDREDHAIADAVTQLFPGQARRCRDVIRRIDSLPGRPPAPKELDALHDALEGAVGRSRQTRPTVQWLKTHLDPLRDGMVKLNAYDAELTPDAIDAVRRLHNVQHHVVTQLREVNALSGDELTAAEALAEQLARPTPWRDTATLAPHLERLTATYTAERTRRLADQEAAIEAARTRVKGRKGFSTLTSDQSHRVLRPLTEAQTDTTAEAIAPSLTELVDRFRLALQQAEEDAIAILDEILDQGSDTLTTKVRLDLHHRELRSEADVDALVDEIRRRVLEPLRSGAKVRLVTR